MEDTDSFLICDAKTRSFTIQYVSKGFQDLFGYDASECVGARCDEVFGSVKLFKDKPGMAALNKVAAELGLSDEQATAGIKRMIKAAEEAAQAASAGGSSKTVLLINSRKNGELFPCEMSLCLNQHPTTGWQYHAGLSRDVSDRISLAKLLKAASSENTRCFDELCQEFQEQTSRSGAGSLQEKLAAGSSTLHEIAQTVWKDELSKVFKPRDGTRAPADLRSIWSRSTASSIASSVQSRPKRSRSESDEAEGSDKEEPWEGIPHLGAFFSQCQAGVSSEAPPAVEGPEQTEESKRFLDLLEGPESDDEDSDGDERMAFSAKQQVPPKEGTPRSPAESSEAISERDGSVGDKSASDLSMEALTLPKPPSTPISPAEAQSGRTGGSEEKSGTDFSMEESSSTSTEEKSPISNASVLGDDEVDPVQLVSRDMLLDLAIPLVMAAPTAQGFPVVLRSKGFQALPEPSVAIPLGSCATEALRPTSMELQQTWSNFCDAITEGHFYVDAATGGGVVALEGFDDVVLPSGEFVFVRPFYCRSGRPVDHLAYLKQVELDNCPYLLAVHLPLPADTISQKEKPQRFNELFDMASARLDDVISELASEFFYYAPMRRQRKGPKLPHGDKQQEEMLKAANSIA